MGIARRRKSASARLIVTIGVVAFAAPSVKAQEAALPQLDPVATPSIGDGGVELDVTRRHRSEFDPRGIPVGSWTLLPSVAAHLGYESNLYGAQTDKTSGGFAEIETGRIACAGIEQQGVIVRVYQYRQALPDIDHLRFERAPIR